MQPNIHFWSHPAQFFLEWEMFQTKAVQKIKTHILCSVIFLFENRAVYEIMWKNILERGRPQMAIWRMRIACWIPKATNTHSQYVILIVFPLQQQLHQRAPMLRYRYSACLAAVLRYTYSACLAAVLRYTYSACLAVFRSIKPARSAHIMTDSCSLVPQSLQPNAKTLC